MISIHTLLLSLTMISSNPSDPAKDAQRLEKEVTAEFARHKGTYALAFKDLGTGREILINAHDSFHAASTMKTPVLIETFKQVAAGKFALKDSIVVFNEFKSIMDGSPYSLDPNDDSEKDLYTKIGTKVTLQNLLYRMITKSSNLATNIVIEIVGAKNANATMRAMGAKDIMVLRGVEDDKAFQAGRNNTVTAYDLMLLFDQLATGKAVSADASKAMIDILLDQYFKDVIPAKLPAGVKVASKSGAIEGIINDSGIVYLPDGRKYVLIVLSRNAENNATATETLATVSKMVYDYYVTAKK